MTTAKHSWNMRYTAHLGLRAPDTPLFRRSAGSAAALAQIDFIADLGFAGVQDNFLKLRSAAEQQRIGAALVRRGLAMGSFTNNPVGWNQPLWGSDDAAARAQLRTDLDDSIAAAARVGGCVATCVTGCAPGLPRSPQFAAMVENLKALADTAARGGIVLGVEAVAEQWIPGLLVNRIADALAIVRAVDHPAVRLLFDFGHVQMQDGDAPRHLAECWDWIGALQLADGPGRVELGAGELDWPAILRDLRARGWTGLLELEHMPGDESIAGEALLLQRLRDIDAASA